MYFEPAAFFMARSPTREDVPLKRTFIPSNVQEISVSDIANRAMRCVKTSVPLGFSPNEPFAGPSKLSAVIASEGSRAASNWRDRIQLGQLIGSAPYCWGRTDRPLRIIVKAPGRRLRDSAPLW